MGKNKVLIDRVPEGNVSSGGGGSGLGEKAQADEGCGVDGEDVVGGGGFCGSNEQDEDDGDEVEA